MTTLKHIMKTAKHYEQNYNTACGVLESTERELNEAVAELEVCEQALQIVQGVAKEVQNRAGIKISEVVTRCLEAVFDESYVFKIQFEQKRNATEAKLLLFKDGQEIDPADSVGGGVLDVASLALRVAALIFAVPHPRRLLILDEPFRFVSKRYRQRVAELLQVLADEFDFQIIMVTHMEEFMGLGTTITI